MIVTCQVCGQGFETRERIGRRDACAKCGADLHACRQCRFYEPGRHNDCRESQAEPVTDKETGNFCGFFSPAEGGPDKAQPKDAKAEAQKMWEQMFGQK